jgi:hypothetical protein
MRRLMLRLLLTRRGGRQTGTGRPREFSLGQTLGVWDLYLGIENMLMAMQRKEHQSWCLGKMPMGMSTALATYAESGAKSRRVWKATTQCWTAQTETKRSATMAVRRAPTWNLLPKLKVMMVRRTRRRRRRTESRVCAARARVARAQSPRCDRAGMAHWSRMAVNDGTHIRGFETEISFPHFYCEYGKNIAWEWKLKNLVLRVENA